MSTYINLDPGASSGSTGIAAGAATEAKQDAVITEIQGVKTDTTSIDAKMTDVNNELDQQTVELQDIEADIEATNLELADIETDLESVDTELDTQTVLLTEIRDALATQKNITLIDKATDNGTAFTYIGSAIKGSVGSGAVWSITRIDTTVQPNVIVTSTDNVVWDNRASEVYS